MFSMTYETTQLVTCLGSRGSSVGVGIRLWVGRSGARFSVDSRYFAFLQIVPIDSGVHSAPHFGTKVGWGCSFPGVRAVWSVVKVATHNAEVKNVWSYTSSPHTSS